ncbi:hypothetical protein C8F01DRAFT_1138445 [Mycena amicta]|nr:hypothetical protein C8F01DRAFT_1138445 [Mycena amicta]
MNLLRILARRNRSALVYFLAWTLPRLSTLSLERTMAMAPEPLGFVHPQTACIKARLATTAHPLSPGKPRPSSRELYHVLPLQQLPPRPLSAVRLHSLLRIMP